MEEEDEKLRKMQDELETSTDPNGMFTIQNLFNKFSHHLVNKEEVDARSVYVGNVSR